MEANRIGSELINRTKDEEIFEFEKVSLSDYFSDANYSQEWNSEGEEFSLCDDEERDSSTDEIDIIVFNHSSDRE